MREPKCGPSSKVQSHPCQPARIGTMCVSKTKLFSPDLGFRPKGGELSVGLETGVLSSFCYMTQTHSAQVH